MEGQGWSRLRTCAGQFNAGKKEKNIKSLAGSQPVSLKISKTGDGVV